MYGFTAGPDRKESDCHAGGSGSIPELGSPEEGDGHPLQYCCLGVQWTEAPGGLQSMGSRESDTTERLTLSHIHTYMTDLFCSTEESSTTL